LHKGADGASIVDKAIGIVQDRCPGASYTIFRGKIAMERSVEMAIKNALEAEKMALSQPDPADDPPSVYRYSRSH